ncbi:Ribosome maturation factor rimM [Bhargavaea cecembensis DSE10]|uniref:Ribosome maturation factor RimM n=1 Tax=Bhargavaea cecembensis DSE10 TaxID=1235279 RepID=M7NK69_9BACL|nr:ribosome maturation factor RimM [Bhargavaea cecembensis]EMR07541.1 Ribosome maturation factor rimM [Bhargavaea cecembensis DSE10]
MNWYNVGKIVNTHGIRGEVRVMSRTDFPEERYAKGARLALFMPGAKEPVMLTVASHRVHKNFDLLTFEGHPNINDVEKYRDGILKVSEADLGELEEGEFYHHEIIGCTVVDQDGREIGKVTEVLETGANDVWAVKPPEGKMHYIPYIEHVVLEVDPENGRIVIDPIEGLLS